MKRPSLRIVFSILSIGLLLLLVGCGSAPQEEPVEAPDVSEEEAEAPPADDSRLIDTLKRLRDLGNTVLEIGAGMGNLTRQLARRRERYVATEYRPEPRVGMRVPFQM